jgi:hypothetical protein
MLATSHPNAVSPDDLGVDGKPDPKKILDILMEKNMQKTYDMKAVPKNAPPPSVPKMTGDNPTVIFH